MRSFKFLGVHSLQDLTWSTKCSYQYKKLHQCLFIDRENTCLRTYWWTSTTVPWRPSSLPSQWKECQWVEKTPQLIDRVFLAVFEDIYRNLSLRNHPAHQMFALLPVGRLYGCLQTTTISFEHWKFAHSFCTFLVNINLPFPVYYSCSITAKNFWVGCNLPFVNLYLWWEIIIIKFNLNWSWVWVRGGQIALSSSLWFSLDSAVHHSSPEFLDARIYWEGEQSSSGTQDSKQLPNAGAELDRPCSCTHQTQELGGGASPTTAMLSSPLTESTWCETYCQRLSRRCWEQPRDRNFVPLTKHSVPYDQNPCVVFVNTVTVPSCREKPRWGDR